MKEEIKKIEKQIDECWNQRSQLQNKLQTILDEFRQNRDRINEYKTELQKLHSSETSDNQQQQNRQQNPKFHSQLEQIMQEVVYNRFQKNIGFMIMNHSSAVDCNASLSDGNNEPLTFILNHDDNNEQKQNTLSLKDIMY